MKPHVWAIALLLGLAAPAGAGTKMYEGSWVLEAFGNDLVGGSFESAQFSFVALPQGQVCNPGFPRCPFASTPISNKGDFSPLGACTPYTIWAPSRPAKGATSTSGGQPAPHAPRYRNKAFFTAGGAPNTTSCAASTTVGGATATSYLGPGDPLRGVVMKGAPLTGSGMATTATTAGMGFALPAAPFTPGSGLRRTAVGDLNRGFPYVYEYTYATLRNSSGSFGPGQGFFSTAAVPSTLSFPYKGVANVVVHAGPNRFGGVMRLLGQITTKSCYFRNSGCSLIANNARYEVIGTSAYESGGVVTSPYSALYSAKGYHTALMATSTVMVRGERFPWTTGSVTVTATGRGPRNTVIRRKGYDNRNSGGVGTVQLVSPTLTHWLQPAASYETGGVAILRLSFLPEPRSAILMFAGLSLLAVFYRWRGRDR